MRLVALVLLLSVSLPAKRPITHADVWTMRRVSSPAVSPDGRWAVVSVTEPSYDKDQTTSDLWIVPVNSGAPRRLTQTRAPESGAVFSPDSTQIAFTTRREGDDAPQVYVLSLAGGDAARVTSVSTGASSPRWRPDGKAILFQSSVYPGAADEEANRREAAARKARKYNARVFTAFPFRQWDQWLDDTRVHPFVQELAPGAKARDLLAGTKLAAQPGFDGPRALSEPDLSAEWTPDGAGVVFTALIDRHRAAVAPTHTHVYLAPASGGEPRALTSGPDSYHNVGFSPDGRWLYVGHELDEEKQLYSLNRLARLEWTREGAKPEILTSRWDRSVGAVTFSPDGRTVYMTAEEHGVDRIFAMPAAGGVPQPVVSQAQGVYSAISAPRRAEKPVLVGLWGSMTHPDDLVVVNPEDRSHRLLTEFNREKIEEIDWAPPRHIWFTARNGKRIHSVMVLPPAFDESRKYPLIVFPHGGPHGMSKDNYFVRWNYHLLTSPGYVLLMTNYTGSTGFGEEFAAAIHSDVLRGPAAEIEEAADDAIRRFPFIDGSRQAAIGASYGGYLMNWFEGHTTRFKCLVNHAGLTDNASMWGSTDGAWYWERRNGGPVWEGAKPWRDQSPATYAANFRTPMLITHGERDYRVPVSQAFEIYKLLQRKEVPARLVIFPDENHWVLSGENARYHMKEVLDWLAKYLGA